MKEMDWEMNTDIDAVFELILQVSRVKNVS